MSNLSDGHKRCPVDYTCPYVDAALEIVHLNAGAVLDHGDAILLVQQLEELRDMNTQLREWGCEEAIKVDKLNTLIKDLERTPWHERTTT